MEKLDIVFKDYPDTSTPLSADNINKIVDKINECIEEINKISEKKNYNKITKTIK